MTKALKRLYCEKFGACSRPDSPHYEGDKCFCGRGELVAPEAPVVDEFTGESEVFEAPRIRRRRSTTQWFKSLIKR